MPRYLLHFSTERGGTARGEWDAVAGADDFTEAIIEALRMMGGYKEAMIIRMAGASIEHVEILDLEAIRNELKTWHQTGVFETL